MGTRTVQRQRANAVILSVACIALALGITDNASGSPQSGISFGKGTPAVSLSTTSLAFGSQFVNTTSTAHTVTLSNTGNATLIISSIMVNGTNRTNFAETNTCGRLLAAGAHCTIGVTFAPSASGSRKASVSITDNAHGSPQTVSLCGTGILTTSTPTAPEDGLSPTSLPFGNQSLGTTSTAQGATLSNSGNAPMNITSLVLTGSNVSDFAQSNTCGTSVAAGGSCTISVTFTPTGSGSRTASVSITDNASGSPQSVSLTGTGNNPAPTLTSLSPASAVAGAGSQTLTLTGTNFLASSTVTYNGVGHTATFVSSTQLTISLSATDQATAGSYAVVVTNPAPGGGTSSALNFALNNPQPTLTSLSPASAVVGAGSQTLTLTGTNFLPSSTVTYNGVGHAATFASSTQLTISLSATDQATAGSYVVVVTNPAPGGGTSSALNFAVNNPQPTLTSLSPASAVVGSAAQTLTLTGTNFLASSTVTYNGVGHTATFVSSTQLTISLSATDQATAGSYAVVVTNPAPGGGTSSALNFAVTVNNPAPTLTSLSPASAVVGAGSQTLALTGTNFLSSSTVTYNGVGHTATFVSSTQLTISLSATDQATAGSYAVVVTNPAPGGGTSSALSFAVNNPQPTLTNLSPASAVAGAGSQTLTLTGTNFLASSTVTYNGVGHTATFVSSTQLTISLSATDQATTGSYAVVVANPAPGGGTSSPLNFAVNNPQPTLTSLSPASAAVGEGSQTLTLTGTNFLASSTVTYNAVGHAATFVSSTQLTISLSATDQATAGSYAVVVTNPAPGGGTSSALSYAVNNPAPTLTSLSPTSGPEGTLVTIVGANFGTAQGTVSFNGTAAPVTSWSPSTIMVAVPAGATSGNVVVTAGGLASNGVSFTVLPLQLPSQAQALAAIEDVNNYWISNNAAGNSDWDQATYFTGDLAAYDATGQANYLSFAQTWATANSYSLTGGNTTTWPDYQAAGQVYIRLYQLSNNSSDLSGITESINGMVNSSVDNEWTWIDAINMSMPDFAELGSIYNNTNYYTAMYALYSYAKYTVGLYDPTTGLWWENGTYVNTSTYWSRGNGWVFAAHAKVLSVLPTSDPHYAEYLSTFTTMAQALAARQQPGGYWNSDLGGTDNAGPESSGTSFFLYGLAWGLNNGILDQSTYLPVVEKAWNFLVNTALQPSGLLGYMQPSTASNGPGPTSATTTFDYGVGAFLLAGGQMALLTVPPNPVPTLTSLSPASATAGAPSQTLTLTGTNFLASSTVTYNGVGHAATFVSSTQLSIGLTAADQATAGSYAVVVTNPAPGGGASSPLNFVINNSAPGPTGAPTLTSLSPASAVAGAGAQTLTLTGTNFLASSTVTYNGVGHAATFVSSTQLTIGLIAADQATTGSYSVVVTNPAPGGGASSPLNFAVNNPVPTLTSLSPASAVVGAASQTLTLTGTNFLASSTVTYNGVGHAATFLSSTQLTIGLTAADQATAGSYAVVVTNPGPGGGTSSPLNFTVASPLVSLSTTSLAFGSQPIDVTSTSPTVTLSNTGNATLSITSLTMTGTNSSDFEQTNTCGSSVAAGANCTIVVMFTPSIAGTEAASLSLADNASGSPQTVSLSGAGTHDVILSWAASTTPAVVGYNVFRGTTSGGESATPLNSTPINGTTYCDSTVQAGQTYYYVVTAVASNDVTQSADSNQVSANVP